MSATPPIGLGIVGCGAVSQIIHLPALAQLPDRFRVAALCDVSRKTLDGVGDQWNVAARSTDYRALLARPDVAAVLVATPHAHHAEIAIAAMEAGKHVLVEKPMCIAPAEADRLIATQARTGVTAQVGYMRRYAPALEEARKLLPPLSELRMARVHDVIGPNALIIDPTSRVIRGDDTPPDFAQRSAALEAELVAAAIGPTTPALKGAFMRLVGLACHDMSAMRALIGTPQRVLFATHRWDGRFITAALDYGSFVCQLEIGVDAVGRMDAHLELYAGSRVIRVEYDTPYVRNLPARLVVTEAHGGVGVAHATSYPTRRDSFVLEWEAFHDCITTGRAPQTPLADAREDVALFCAIAAAMR